ncbi:hypothetical protein ACIRPT_39995 [Streptomyces sp. NPDC101227]|uniref:hypothetical protein n=1 Tax=Streptomyces sp. NPDC101227 TaxID=3366136 RepID=UPI00380E80C7
MRYQAHLLPRPPPLGRNGGHALSRDLVGLTPRGFEQCLWLRRRLPDLVGSAPAAASTHAIGKLMLEVAPAYLSDGQAADVLRALCDEIGEDLQHGLAARRYAPLTGDRRALHGTVL